MAKCELVVEGNVYLGGEIVKAAIGIDQGRISVVKKTLKGERNADHGDNLIIPGAVDPHVHLRDPGQTHKEDFHTGTLAAAYGGVTTVLDMPNNRKPVNNRGRLAEKSNMADRKSCVDFGLFSAVYDMPQGDLEYILDRSIGLKLYLGPTTGNLCHSSWDQAMKELDRVMDRARGEDRLTVTVHCEDGDRIKEREDKYGGEINSLVDYSHVRDTAGETATISMLLDHISGRGIRKGININIAHVTAPQAFEVIQRRKGEGMQVSCEVTPHHIFLNQSFRHPRYQGMGMGKVNPPLRDIDIQREIWNAVAGGQADMIGSDHAPHSIDEKNTDLGGAEAGLPGLETTVPLLLYLLKRQNMTLNKMLELVSEGPARIFDLDSKGRIEEGGDADLLVVDFRKERVIKGDRLHSKCGWTPYEGKTGIFPSVVYLRGEPIIEDGNFQGKRGGGKQLSAG